MVSESPITGMVRNQDENIVVQLVICQPRGRIICVEDGEIGRFKNSKTFILDKDEEIEAVQGENNIRLRSMARISLLTNKRVLGPFGYCPDDSETFCTTLNQLPHPIGRWDFGINPIRPTGKFYARL